MSAGPLHPELHLDSAPPRITALPHVYTAPVALIVGGVLLIAWGSVALASPWSSTTLAITHVGTLGFLTMVCVGVFPPLVAVAGGCALPWPRATHVVYYALVATVFGLTLGVARAQAAPVFFAIGAAGVMGVVFLVQGAWALRRAAPRGSPTVRGLGVALWSFFLAVSLGIWLAHGHGGMRFPGPRPLWMQVHLTVGLVGWVGGMIAALSWEVAPARLGGRAVAPRAARAVGRAIAVGVTAPPAVVLAQFFGLLQGEERVLAAALTVCSLPAICAVWIVHPWIGLRSLRGAPSSAALLFLRTGLGLGPVVLVAGLLALVSAAPRLDLLFGWLAIVGWAGGLLAGTLMAVVPALLVEREPQPVASRDELPRRLALVAHIAVLGVGAIAIVTGADLPARAAGALLLAEGLLLLVVVARACRRR